MIDLLLQELRPLNGSVWLFVLHLPLPYCEVTLMLSKVSTVPAEARPNSNCLGKMGLAGVLSGGAA